jgi:hypothetical protein
LSDDQAAMLLLLDQVQREVRLGRVQNLSVTTRAANGVTVRAIDHHPNRVSLDTFAYLVATSNENTLK